MGWEGRQANRGWVGEHRHTGRERERDGHLERQTVLEYTGEQRERQTDRGRGRQRERRPCSVMLYMLLLDSHVIHATS